jgi:hypothetical protein
MKTKPRWLDRQSSIFSDIKVEMKRIAKKRRNMGSCGICHKIPKTPKIHKYGFIRVEVGKRHSVTKFSILVCIKCNKRYFTKRE